MPATETLPPTQQSAVEQQEQQSALPEIGKEMLAVIKNNFNESQSQEESLQKTLKYAEGRLAGTTLSPKDIQLISDYIRNENQSPEEALQELIGSNQPNSPEDHLKLLMTGLNKHLRIKLDSTFMTQEVDDAERTKSFMDEEPSESEQTNSFMNEDIPADQQAKSFLNEEIPEDQKAPSFMDEIPREEAPQVTQTFTDSPEMKTITADFDTDDEFDQVEAGSFGTVTKESPKPDMISSVKEIPDIVNETIAGQKPYEASPTGKMAIPTKDVEAYLNQRRNRKAQTLDATALNSAIEELRQEEAQQNQPSRFNARFMQVEPNTEDLDPSKPIELSQEEVQQYTDARRNQTFTQEDLQAGIESLKSQQTQQESQFNARPMPAFNPDQPQPNEARNVGVFESTPVLNKMKDLLKEERSKGLDRLTIIQNTLNQMDDYELVFALNSMQEDLLDFGMAQKNINTMKTTEEKKRFVKEVASAYLWNRLNELDNE